MEELDLQYKVEQLEDEHSKETTSDLQKQVKDQTFVPCQYSVH